VDASSEAVTGFEALIRWDHPEHGPVSPVEFIPLAEEIGLINEIGEWVLRTACAEAGKWPQNISVAVNLSPVQFKSHALPTVVRTILSETDFPAKRLELEITEGVFLNNDEHVHEMIAALKAIGLKLALDDFGTGYSSLSYLQRVPFDKIKIDRSFVTGASDPEGRNAALIRAMVGLASDLKMQTTAEGVETHEELPLGAEVELDFAAGGLIAAEVKWSKGTQFGCQFKEKFNLKLLQPAKTDTKGPAVMAPDYLKAGDAGGK